MNSNSDDQKREKLFYKSLQLCGLLSLIKNDAKGGKGESRRTFVHTPEEKREREKI